MGLVSLLLFQCSNTSVHSLVSVRSLRLVRMFSVHTVLKSSFESSFFEEFQAIFKLGSQRKA